MKKEYVLPVPEVVGKADIERRIGRVGVRGLSREKAEELGLFTRLSYLLCAMHALTTVAYRLYGEIDMWLTNAGAKRHEVKTACVRLESALDKWFDFWKDYQTEQGKTEMNADVEDLYKQFMRWADLPLYWNLGEEQRLKQQTEPLIEVDNGDTVMRIYRDVAERELLGEVNTEWGVMVADTVDDKKVMRCVYHGMDKSAAQMSARRMSAEDSGHFYIASELQTVSEKRVEIIPLKVFKGGESVGSIKKVIKK